MTGLPAAVAPLRLADGDTLADLVTFLRRAQRADPSGAARLVAHGDVLAVYVAAVAGPGPLVLGLRTLALAEVSGADATLPLESLLSALEGATDVTLALPSGGPSTATARPAGAGWAGVTPPRRGWEPVGALDPELLAERAAAGIAQVATGTPPGAGAAAVAALRGRVWGAPLVAALPDLPAGTAFAVQVLGFADPTAPAAVYRCGPWWRVTTSRGHVLARRPVLGPPLVAGPSPG